MMIEQGADWAQTVKKATGQVLMVWGDHTLDTPSLHVFGFYIVSGVEHHFYRQLGVLGDRIWTLELPKAADHKPGIATLNQRAAEAFMLFNQTLTETKTAVLFQQIPQLMLFYPDQDFMPVAFWLLKNNPALQSYDWGLEMAQIKAFGVDLYVRAMAHVTQPTFVDALEREYPAHMTDTVYEQWLIHMLDRQQQPGLVLQFAQAWLKKTQTLDEQYRDRLIEKNSYFDLDNVGEFLESLNFSLWPKDIRLALQQPLQ